MSADRPERSIFPAPTMLEVQPDGSVRKVPRHATRQELDALRAIGVHDWDIVAYTDAAEQKTITGLAAAPERPDTETKYWLDNGARKRDDIETWGYVFLDESNPVLDLTSKEVNEGFAHEITMGVISTEAAAFLRDRPEHFSKMPRLTARLLSRDRASELNLKQQTANDGPDSQFQLGYPIARLRVDPTRWGFQIDGIGYTTSFPDDYVPVFDEAGEVVLLRWGAWKPPVTPQPQPAAIPAEPSHTGGPATGLPVPAPSPTVPLAPPVGVAGQMRDFGDGLQVDALTGEAFCNGLNTGFSFLAVVQNLPVGGGPGDNLSASSAPQYLVPWAFATLPTAEKVMSLMKAHSTSLNLSIVQGDRNERFPTSTLQYQIEASRGTRKARVNAGLIASEIARTTAWDEPNHRQVQSYALAIGNALNALSTELDFEPEGDGGRLLGGRALLGD